MIALPGLTLTTGRFDIARDILLAFSNAADMGMLPNRFPDSAGFPNTTPSMPRSGILKPFANTSNTPATRLVQQNCTTP